VTQQTMPRLVSSDVVREEPGRSATATATEAAVSLQGFGHRLLSEHPELLRGVNGVVSPASIGVAFAMLRTGAEGETAEQIDSVFGFPADDAGRAYNSLTSQWMADGRDAPELSVANSLFVQNGFALRQLFLDALARDFGAGVQTVDFAGDAADVINAWVKEQTRDRIDRLFDVLPPDTGLVLANAIYLKAKWTAPFTSQATRDDEFWRASGESVRVPFMHQAAYFDHARGPGWSALRLPYEDDELAMWVLLPDSGRNPVALLDPKVLSQATGSATSQRIKISLPKWDFKTDAPLTHVLPAMGMPRAFTRKAQFDGVAKQPLEISQVMHRADITVDEEGTEAAAVTGIAMRVVSLPQPPDLRFDADHPFAFVVLHEPTSAPLFEGVVGDPSVT
jgi:serine protease inhibitor